MSVLAPRHKPLTTPPAAVDHGEEHLHRGLKNRHIQLIALGGAIGTGLFYGAGQGVGMAGPGILLAYALGGLVIFFIMRAIGELAVHEPVSGSFSYCAYKYWGDLPGFFSGWNYWFNYIAVSMAELVVVGRYVQFWFPDVPTWVSSAVFLVLVTAVNLVSVKAFGEFEFWFAIVKVVAIVALILFGLWIVLFGTGTTPATGISNLWRDGGFLPMGLSGLAMAMVVVLFSFGGVELIGITAGEAADPEKSIPAATNQVVYRILIFYVGAIFVMLAIFPWRRIAEGKGSPFVEIFSHLGIAGAASILNVVVLTAAVSAYNSGLYSNGRMLYSLAHQGNAPAFLGRTNAQGSPWAGVVASSCVTAIAVLLNYLIPEKLFLYVISIALFAAITNWSMILITQIIFRRRIGPEAAAQLHYRMPLFPFSNYLALVAMGATLVMMAFIPDFQIALVVGPLWVLGLVAAYFVKKAVARRRSQAPIA